MMVSCPGCNTQYSIDERRIPARGGSLSCRECGTKWKIGHPPAAPSHQEATPRPEAAPAAPASLLPVSDSSGSLQNPVNCPKCGHLFVPSHPQAPQPPPRTASTGKHARATRPEGRVLLIEDQHYFAELTREALGEGIETTVVSNLRDARARLGGSGFDLIILDLSLEEGQDGTQLLNATRDMGIPVLIFTARDETELYSGAWDALKAAGATDILIKGMNVGEELRQKVRELLSSKHK